METNLPVAEVSRVIAEKWKEADPNLKLELQMETVKEFAAYAKAMQEYNSSLTEQDKGIIESNKIKVDEEKNKKKIRKEIKASGRPKKPRNGYLLYLEKRFPQLDKTASHTEIIAKISKEWNLLDAGTKSHYETMHKKSVEQYELDLMEWEQKMIDQGKEYLIKKKAQFGTFKTPTKKEPKVV